MADIVVTAANVAWVSGGTDIYLCGEAITQGQPIALDESDSKVYRSDANSATAARQTVTAIALSAGSANQLIVGQTDGIIQIGGTTSQGVPYVASATAGGIAPHTDLAAGWKVIQIGAGLATVGQIELDLHTYNVTYP